MVAFLLVQDAIDQLSQNKKTTKCSEMIALLESLGFDVTTGKAENHKVFVHMHLDQFHSSGFSCEHGKDKALKLPYVLSVIRVLKMHTDDLNKYLNPE